MEKFKVQKFFLGTYLTLITDFFFKKQGKKVGSGYL